MTSLSRRALLGTASCAATALLAPRPARAAEFTYKYANNLPDAHPMNVRAREAAARILAESGGRLELQVFPNSQLGSDTDVLSQVRYGAVEFFTLSGLILSTFVPAASINGVGFAFPDYPTVWKAMDGELGAYVRGEIEAAGLTVMERMWDNGFRQITSSTRPIMAPGNLEGFKIRVPVSPLWTSMFEAFGAAPTSINFNEVYSSLQTRVVEGQENPLAIISTARPYEVQDYCSLTNHMWDGFWFLANRDAWDALPDDLKAIVARNINEAAMAERADVARLNASLSDRLAGQGLVFNATRTEPFREALRVAGFYDEWKGIYGEAAWGLLERSAGRLV